MVTCDAPEPGPARSDPGRLHEPEAVAHSLLGVPFATLDGPAKNVARHVAQRRHIARNLAVDPDTLPASRGQRAADAVARFGGSWTFVGLFATTMVLWVVLNAAYGSPRATRSTRTPTSC